MGRRHSRHERNYPIIMNNITLVGRAGRDPEVRYLDNGEALASLSLAVDNLKKDSAPEWFNLEIWGKTAQVAADYVRKGKLLAVSGSMHQQKWTDRNTAEEKSKWVVRVDRLKLLGSKSDDNRDAGTDPERAAPGAPSPAAQRCAPAAPAWSTASPAPAHDPMDDELPF